MDGESKSVDQCGRGVSILKADGRSAAAPRTPTFDEERRVLRERLDARRVIGVDEVGRGPLAGPVVAGAAWLSEAAAARLAEAGLRDSKALSAKRRDALALLIGALEADGLAEARLGAASAREIEALNIRNATFLAMRRAVGRLSFQPDFALVDGDATPPDFCPAQALKKGDARSLSIAAAAVLAKTVRDRAMARLGARWPAYQWAQNSGYPTAAHREALASQGASPHHRATFGAAAPRGA